jgi:hypothetical protein
MSIGKQPPLCASLSLSLSLSLTGIRGRGRVKHINFRTRDILAALATRLGHKFDVVLLGDKIVVSKK